MRARNAAEFDLLFELLPGEEAYAVTREQIMAELAELEVQIIATYNLGPQCLDRAGLDAVGPTASCHPVRAMRQAHGPASDCD